MIIKIGLKRISNMEDLALIPICLQGTQTQLTRYYWEGISIDYISHFADILVLAKLKSLVQVVSTMHITLDGISVPIFCFYFHFYEKICYTIIQKKKKI